MSHTLSAACALALAVCLIPSPATAGDCGCRDTCRYAARLEPDYDAVRVTRRVVRRTTVVVREPAFRRRAYWAWGHYRPRPVPYEEAW